MRAARRLMNVKAVLDRDAPTTTVGTSVLILGSCVRWMGKQGFEAGTADGAMIQLTNWLIGVAALLGFVWWGCAAGSVKMAQPPSISSTMIRLAALPTFVDAPVRRPVAVAPLEIPEEFSLLPLRVRCVRAAGLSVWMWGMFVQLSRFCCRLVRALTHCLSGCFVSLRRCRNNTRFLGMSHYRRHPHPPIPC